MGEPTDSKVRKLRDITFEGVICKQFPILTTKLHGKCKNVEKLKETIVRLEKNEKFSQKRIKQLINSKRKLLHVSKVLDRVGPNEKEIIGGLVKDKNDLNKKGNKIFNRQRAEIKELKEENKKLEEDKKKLEEENKKLEEENKKLETHVEKCDEVITKQRKIIPIRE